MRKTSLRIPVLCLVSLLAACGGSEPQAVTPPAPSASTPPAASTPPVDTSAPTPPAPSASAEPTPATPPAPAKPTAALSLKDAGFATPESVFYDAKNDVYLVSNINGGPSAADNNGFISRVSPDGKVELKWIEAGKKGVKLDAPKGMAAVGDTLYVADLTRVRMFDLNKGTPKGEVALPGATFANDVAAAPDGKVCVSDSGIKIDEKGIQPTKTDAVYVIEKNKAKAIAKGEDLGHPNGLLFADGKLWVVTFGTGELYSLDAKGAKGDAQKLPKGTLDGIVAVKDGLLISSWEGQAIYRGKPGGTFDVAIPGLKAPADIGYDTKRSRVLVPLFQDNAVEAYDQP